MQVWHGTEGDVLRHPNFKEEIKQGTNVMGVSQTPPGRHRHTRLRLDPHP